MCAALVKRMRSGPASGRGGMTLVELVLVMGILAMAFGMLTTTMLANDRQRQINRESAVAAEAARDIFERMRNQDFDELFSIYNAIPADDPGGAGTAVGNTFDVPGLDVPAGSGRPAVGEIVFPATLTPKGKQPLREDFTDAALGMPRDLNGDSIVDDRNHAFDYMLLPVRIELQWEGLYGPRELTVCMLMADFKK